MIARSLVAALALLGASAAMAETPAEVAARYGMAGELLVAKGDHVLLDQGFGTIAPEGGEKHVPGERWRLASVTKQIVATLAMEQVAAGHLGLDAPVGFISGDHATPPFVIKPRMLLTHHSGLANPDTTAVLADGVPSFYQATQPDQVYCQSRLPQAGSPFSYNNCDYVLLATLLDVGNRRPLAQRRPSGMAMARPGERGVPGFVHGKPEPASFQLASWGAAGGLIGTAPALFAFDRALMTGKLLPPAALTELWKPEGNGSYQALGQWVFPGSLKGCDKPKRIVQRDGEIYGVQVRNFILPDDNLVVILFTNRSADDFPLGEVWEGKGFVYDLLSAAACPA